jgi:hypothetical protein
VYQPIGKSWDDVKQSLIHIQRIFGRAELVSSFLRTFEPDRSEEPSLFVVPNT